MKPFYHLVLILLLWLFMCPCLGYLTIGRNRTSNNIQCIDTERDALLQFKHRLTNDTCGLLTSWESHTDCCRWRGVVCSTLTNHVVKLIAGSEIDSCLEGKVSPSLGELKHLEHLNLSYNDFYGEIPHQLGNLSTLTTLDLSYSGFKNEDAVKTSLSWLSRLTLLRYLDLSGANLSEVRNWMTVVNNLPSLQVLSMEYCDLSLEIPSSISFVNSSATLHSIILSGNNFNDSSIFQWLFNFPGITTQLVHLDLSGNTFQFPIPTEFENFHNLTDLKLSGNGFQGTVSETISKLCNLEQLYLAKNNFTDELSNVIDSLVNCNNKTLLVLDLSFNGFWGAIPDGVGLFPSLRELHLSGNQLIGEISPGIRQLTMLEILEFSSNSLEGTLTHTLFSSLVSLRQLSLSYNSRLVISIEDDWIPPFNLDIIELGSCKLGPRFPKWLQLQTNFSFLDISNTGISDNVPVSYWNSLSSNLFYLNMSNNQFYGMLPNLLHISNVFVIDLSSNLFEGVVPSGFANTSYLYLNDNRFSNCSYFLCPKTKSNLEKLDLSNNLFSGELPDCWMNFGQLESLHLENNNFSGRIPKSLGTLLNLQFLHLYKNSFSGPLSATFESLTSLTILNLGYNLLSGYIPPWIGIFSQSLGAIILRKNQFVGEMPESICQLKKLQILDLAINHISGVIPNCIGTFMAMQGINSLGLDFELDEQFFPTYSVTEIRSETVIVSWKREERGFKETIRFVKYIDLSSNELRGEIPDGISSLTALGALDLSGNNLTGYIPSEIGNLKALELLVELLDLSNNHFTGEIPISLAKVTTLDVMNLSNNNLSGEIPVSTQLQSFDLSSYTGNPGLCGAPLSSCSKHQEPSNEPNGDSTSVQNKDDDFCFFLGLYISVVLGFIVGFWGVCGTLVIKTSWRHAYFRLLDNIKVRIM